MRKKIFTHILVIAVMGSGLVGIVATSANAAVVDRSGKPCYKQGEIFSSGGITVVCANENGALKYSAARKLSGSLTVVCSPQETWCVAMTRAFQAKTGVSTKFVRLSSGEAVARLAIGKSNPEFDVWHGGPADGFVAARIQNLLDTYVSPTRDMIPVKYQDEDGYWTGVYVGALGFCSNPKELRRLGVKVPTSWEDLLDPKLKKNIMMAHPSTSGTAFTTVWTQVVRLGSESAAMTYMKSLHNNILQYTRSGAGPVAPVGRGEVAIGIVFSHDCVTGREQGLPLKLSFPLEGTGYEIGGVALIKGAKNPEAAKAYIDFALSASAQNLGPTAAAYQVLTNKKAKTDRRMVVLASLKIVDYNFEKAGAAKKALTAKFDAEIAPAPKS